MTCTSNALTTSPSTLPTQDDLGVDLKAHGYVDIRHRLVRVPDGLMRLQGQDSRSKSSRTSAFLMDASRLIL